MPPSGGIVQDHFAVYSFIITYFTLIVNHLMGINKVFDRDCLNSIGKWREPESGTGVLCVVPYRATAVSFDRPNGKIIIQWPVRLVTVQIAQEKEGSDIMWHWVFSIVAGGLAGWSLVHWINDDAEAPREAT